MRNLSPIEDHASGVAPQGFSALGLASSLNEAVRAAGYRDPTPIQTQAIPHVMRGRDLLGCARTGTGKTAAFALPILHQLLAEARETRPGPRALVLAPTRELAAQIGADFALFARGSRLRVQVVFGGVGKRPQVDALRRGVDVLVATPGRLLDLMGDRAVDLGRVRHFVLDEADRMLDMGFIRDVQRISKAVPQRRQTLLFSATMPKEIAQLAGRLLVDPLRVAVDPVSSTVEPVSQGVYFVDTGRKGDLLLALLRDEAVERALVFTRTKHGANRVAKKLVAAGVGAGAIHGNKSQSARERVLEDFKRGRTRVVVATDIAARGIDVKGLSHVINFDVPVDAESYVHRIGRTGRAGAGGVALSLCAGEERSYLAAIERLTRRPLDRLEAPGFAPSPERARPSGPSGAARRGGDRPGESRGSRRPQGAGRPRRGYSSSRSRSAR